MLDIKLLRNNFKEVEEALARRNEDFDLYKFKDLDSYRNKMADRLRIKSTREMNKGIKLNLKNISLL